MKIIDANDWQKSCYQLIVYIGFFEKVFICLYMDVEYMYTFMSIYMHIFLIYIQNYMHVIFGDLIKIYNNYQSITIASNNYKNDRGDFIRINSIIKTLLFAKLKPKQSEDKENIIIENC